MFCTQLRLVILLSNSIVFLMFEYMCEIYRQEKFDFDVLNQTTLIYDFGLK